MPEFQLFAVRIFVSDWERALSFYGDVLGMDVVFENDMLGWAQFDTGECTLAIERADLSDPESAALVGRFVGVSLKVDDIDAVYRRLTEAGVEFESPPQKQTWGGQLAHFRDPDGNTLTLLG